MYAWHNVGVLVWDGSASLAGVQRIDAALSALRDAHGMFSVVHLLHGRTGLPSVEVRAEFERLAKTHELSIAYTAILDDREGFVAGAVKAVITGVSLVARARLDIRIFTRVEKLVAWLAPAHAERTGVQLDPGEFRDVLNTAFEAAR